MNPKLQELYEKKIKIYETMIKEIKDIDFELIMEFEKEFKQIENIDRQIQDDPKLSMEKLMKVKL
jgi:hypothetical protein